MKELSILFTAENRAKVRSGDKTQTRRATGLEYVNRPDTNFEFHGFSNEGDALYAEFHDSVSGDGGNFKAKYRKGDHLWMLEPYQIDGTYHEPGLRRAWGYYSDDRDVFDLTLAQSEWDRWSDRKKPYRKTSSRFMYKSLARTWVEVIDVRVERVKDISEADAKAEGIETFWDGQQIWYKNYLGNRDFNGFTGAIASFDSLWDSINAKRGLGCDVNPWVLVYEFKLIKKSV
jgi:hypothetical protein